MCTAVRFFCRDHYFGRNLDLEYAYDEQVVITPRHYPFVFRSGQTLPRHHAIIGMAYVREGYPLYYEACNEKGLCMAGLRFAGNAVYHPPRRGMENIAPFELTAWVLGRCDDLQQARALLENTNVTAVDFDTQLPATPLHWLISDRDGALAAEPGPAGLQLYENTIGVLTNNPPFPFHRENLALHRGLQSRGAENRLAPDLSLPLCSGGSGSLGLPGDLTSPSRFLRAAFFLHSSISSGSEEENVQRMFRILSNCAQLKGSVQTRDGRQMYTRYSSCFNASRQTYYYSTYENSRITALQLRPELAEGSALHCYPLQRQPVFDRGN